MIKKEENRKHLILVINPGSTSTKVALYEDESELFSENISHSREDLTQYKDILEQNPYREQVVRDVLATKGIDPNSLSAVVARGGILPPVKAGAYLINDSMLNDLRKSEAIHASSLAAMIADSIAGPLGIPAMIYDAVTVDEFREIARITGFPEHKRYNVSHVLNGRAMARKYAATQGKEYGEIKVIVAHLGGGITIAAHDNGRIVDSEADDQGPFGAERSGAAPLFYVVDLCFSGKYDKSAILKMIRGNGGLKAHLGTSDIREVEAMIQRGDEYARLVYDALIYQIAKGVGMLLPVMDRVDAIILTGGIAHSKQITGRLHTMLDRFAPVVVFPGENEMVSLAAGALRVLRGQEEARIYGADTVLPK